MMQLGDVLRAALAVFVLAATQAHAAPPNVVVILADDLGFSDLGCYGGEIDTPNLDRLAAGGLRFTQGYNTARCWPTRAALLTGYYAQAVRRDSLPGGKGGQDGTRPAWARLLPELLAPAGYVSYHSGKWHVDGDPREQGFARSLAVSGAGESNYFDGGGVTEDGRPAAADPGFYTTTAIGDHAVKCLQEHAAAHPARPFFHYIPFTAPHFPLQAPADLVAKYRERYRAGWDEVRRARVKRIRGLGIVTSPAAEPEESAGPPHPKAAETLARYGAGEVDRPVPWQSLTPEQQEFQATKMAIHAAMIEAMDRQIGRVVAQLEAMHALEDTLILFASDNGASAEITIRGEGHDPAAAPGSRKSFLCLGPGWSTCSNAPFRRHKMWVHEGGIATPWIVHWPRGIAAKDAFRTQPVHVVDVVPTVLEVAGVAPPRECGGRPVPPLHGRSFAKALADPAAPPAHGSLWWCHGGNRAVRVGDWKLVEAKKSGWELYDLASDRCETRNLAAAQPARVRELEAEWKRIADECRELAAETPRPNILFLFSDDHARHALSCYGSRVNHTPHLDRLAAGGARFTNSFVTNSICSPSRATLLTGQYSHRNGVPVFNAFDGSRDTVVKRLQAAGYHTGLVGKWHLGSPPTGFDRWIVLPGQGAYWNPEFLVPGGRLSIEGHCTAITGDLGIEFIETRPADKPFFLMVHHKAPHRGWQPDDRNRAKFANAVIPEPETLFDDYATRPAALPENEQTIARHLTNGDLKRTPPAGLEPEAVKRWLRESPTEVDVDGSRLTGRDLVGWKYRRFMQDYLACVQGVDDSVGKLLDHLDTTGLAANTVVIYTTDNGWYMGDLGLYDKRLMYEPGLCTPLLARGPGVKAGIMPDQLVANIDLAPTFLDLAGLPVPESMQGRSLAPLLRGERPADWRTSVYYRYYDAPGAHHTPQHYGVRTAGHKLIRYFEEDAWELFDLAADPHEQRNLLHGDAAARSPEVASLFTEMQAELARLRGLYGDDDRYADPRTWPTGSVDVDAAASPPLGTKSVAAAMALARE